MRNQHADITFTLAFHAHAGSRNVRLAAGECGRDQFNKLIFIDRAASKLKVYLHVFGYRGGKLQGGDVLRRGIYGANHLLGISPVAECLYTARSGAGPDRNQGFSHTG